MAFSILYVIRSKELPAHKIGVTNNWHKRQQQLEVGTKADPVHVVRVNDAGRLERFLHRRFKAKRLPQTEWFLNFDDDDLSFIRSALLKAKDDYDRAQAQRPTPVPAPASAKPQPQWYADHLAREQANQERQARRAAAEQVTNVTCHQPPPPKPDPGYDLSKHWFARLTNGAVVLFAIPCAGFAVFALITFSYVWLPILMAGFFIRLMLTSKAT